MKCKVVNVEEGMPAVETGVKRLYFEIMTARRQGVKVLKVIHGYGSTGVGGRLKKGILDYLAAKKKEGIVKEFIPGESFDIFNHATRQAMEQYRELGSDRDLGNCNPGITLVLL